MLLRYLILFDFGCHLLFEIPSIICSIFVLSHLVFNRILRHALYNHIIIIILVINLIVQVIDIPWILHYYRLNSVSPATHTYCMIWTFVDESLSITTTIIFAWATIERHILIFHDRWVSTRIKILLVHYLPIGFLSLYCLCYSIVVIIVPPCENRFNYTLVVCGHPLCYYENTFVALWDAIINHMIPTFVIILSSATLFGRILYQKKRCSSTNSMAKTSKDGYSIIVNLGSISYSIYTRNDIRICLSLRCFREDWSRFRSIC